MLVEIKVKTFLWKNVVSFLVAKSYRLRAIIEPVFSFPSLTQLKKLKLETFI